MQKGPKWIILQGVDVDLPEGFHASGAEEGFFAPTNQENAVGAPKKKYLTEAPIARPNFSKKPTKPKDGNAPRPVGRPPTSTSPKEQGHPSKYAINKLLPIDFARRRPKDYFNLFMTDGFVAENIVKPTNARASAEGAGSATYKDFVGFDAAEVYKFFGLLFANSVSPKPQVVHWFMSTRESKIFGNDAFAKLFDKKNAKIPMAGPISRQPLAFPNSQHFRLPRLDRPEASPPIAVAATMTAAPYRDISLSPFACHLSPAAISPWPPAISCR
jgi:hypothetical protein